MTYASRAAERRKRDARLEVDGLVYVKTPHDSTFVLNLSESGMAIQAMEVLEPGCAVPFSLPLPKTDSEVKGMARVAWTDRSGRAGLEFTHLDETYRFRLKQWVIKNQN
jgi:hypothetical protein